MVLKLVYLMHLRSNSAFQVELEDDETAKKRSSVDDEYVQAGARDPKVCVTTSRDPSSRLKQFAKELKLVVPNAQRINRGNHKVSNSYAFTHMCCCCPKIFLSLLPVFMHTRKHTWSYKDRSTWILCATKIATLLTHSPQTLATLRYCARGGGCL